MRLILIIAFVLNFLTTGFSQNTKTLKIENEIIDVEKIPFDVKSNLKEYFKTEIIDGCKYKIAYIDNIYSSKNKERFLLESIRVIDSKIDEYIPLDIKPEVKFSFFDIQGSNLWKMEANFIINQCKISNDGRLMHISVDKGLDHNSSIITFNSSGKVIFEINEIFESRFIPNSEGDLLFYNKLIDGTITTFKTDFKDPVNISNYKIKIGELYNVSANGNNILYWRNDSILCTNRDNDLIWKDKLASNSFARISYTGDKTAIINNKSQITFIDNRNGEKVCSVKLSDNICDDLEFVENGNIIGIIDLLPNKELEITIMNFEGDILGISQIRKIYEWSIHFQKNGDIVNIYMDGINSDLKMKTR